MAEWGVFFLLKRSIHSQTISQSVRAVKYLQIMFLSAKIRYPHIFTPIGIGLWLSRFSHAHRLAERVEMNSGWPQATATLIRANFGPVFAAAGLFSSLSVKYVSCLPRWGIILSLHDLSPPFHHFNLGSYCSCSVAPSPLPYFSILTTDWEKA